LVRIVQEALNNVRKHARAEHIWVSCSEDEGELRLEIRDDGIGYSTLDLPNPSRHGLRGMRERAELIGAELQVTSQPGQGSVVRICLAAKASEEKG
jgi:two-component system nitrate/nitrite sensor histidine kinase NarX